MFVHFFSLHENHDGHLAGLLEAKPEKLGKICPYRKDVPFFLSTILYSCKFFVSATVKAL